MVDPTETGKLAWRIIVTLATLLILYMLLSNVTNILDRLGIQTTQKKLEQQITLYQKQVDALQTENTSLKKSLQDTEANYKNQLEAVSKNAQQVIEQKDKEKKQLQDLAHKQNTKHSSISSTAKETDTTITLDKEKINELSQINIQAINEAYTQDFGG